MDRAPGEAGRAVDYDELARKYRWYGHEALFGMMFENLRKGQALLDLGIGTGLSSRLFHLAGLEVSGLDTSDEMLAECRRKGFARELKKYDISRHPLPYPDRSFDIVLAVGVLHFFRDPEPFFSEARRLLREGGAFGITIVDPGDEGGEAVERSERTSHTTYWCHAPSLIDRLAGKHGLRKEKELVFFGYDMAMEPMRNTAYVLVPRR
jgi:SAM-dependent methyltransferase